MAKVNIKERNFKIKILKFDNGYILQRLMASSKSLTSAETESRVHVSNFLLCHDVLFTRYYHMTSVLSNG